MAEVESYDVVVVGSGAAGAMTALRLADQGLKPLIIEKAQKFGGTSAVSGGVMWLPNHRLDGDAGDSRESSLEYLDSIITKPVNRERLETYVDTASEMAHYLRSTGVELVVAAWPDWPRPRGQPQSKRQVALPSTPLRGATALPWLSPVSWGLSLARATGAFLPKRICGPPKARY